jgi:hypothetical protein
MHTLAPMIQPILDKVRSVFRETVWEKAKIMLVEAIQDCSSDF